MKKVSTAAAQPSRIFSQQKLTIGLDLGDRNSWFCVVDETGKIQLEQQVRTSTKALQQVFGAMPRSRIALEIGTHSPWISRLLGQWGHEVHRGQCAQGTADRGEPQERRSSGCADLGAAGPDRSPVAVSGEASQGDAYLRTLLVQGAQHILGPFGVDCDLRRWGLKLAERGGRNGKT